jgi:5'-nucleotidase (lipoprotein e(P4) family)
VILDADETVLDNSEYERRRAVLDSAYTEPTWAVWVNEATAPAVPGAVAFTEQVHRMGGRVVIVTNRADALCGPTRANLEHVGVRADLVLCQPPGESDKNPRFERVERGTASQALPALTVVEWLGDNIQDFPHLTQDVRNDPAAFAAFGRTFFVIPNPVYGSWQRNEAP